MEASKAGRLLLVGFAPEEIQEVECLAREERLGGVILFERNARSATELGDLTARLAPKEPQGACPLMVALDQELGRVCRIRQGVTLFPGAPELGFLDRPATTLRVARWVALELMELGVHLNLAPVADVPQGPPFPSVLQGRTFGQDPAKVASHVTFWVRGSQRAGLACCVKHFPGHGSVQEDSHLELPVDPSPLHLMKTHHLVPFEAAFKAEVASVMLSHVLYPELDPQWPASLSSRIVQGLLRKRLGFRGLVITDDLEMEAVAGSMGALEAAVRAICAGTDMVLVGRNLKAAVGLTQLVEGLEKAVVNKEIPRERFEEALGRSLSFKARWVHSTARRRAASPPMGAKRLAGKLFREVMTCRGS
ncbi:MAG: beta-N-acetylhexosaminidase [Thermodesulfobacteriota bacterium]